MFILAYKIIANACCDLPLEFVEETTIHFINITININRKEFLDDLDKAFSRTRKTNFFIEHIAARTGFVSIA